MKLLNTLTFLAATTIGMAAPEARQAAPEQAPGPERPIIRCGVGEIEIMPNQRPARIPQINPKECLKAFPAPEKGMVRFVAELPKLEEEQAFKVEIIVGKTVEVDTANRHIFGGKLEAETIKGWGYTRYILPKIGPMAGTLRARIGGPQKEERFVTIAGEPYLIHYNSRLPVVVYVPEGVEVKFRVWSAGERVHEMEEG